MLIPLTPIRFLQRAVTVYGGNTAVVCGQERWTYAQFGERVERLANALADFGLQPGQRVAFLGYNCHRLLECYYGVVKMGGVLLPLNIRLAPSDFEYIFNDAQPVVALVHPDFAGKLAPVLDSLTSVKRFIMLEPSENPPQWAEGLYDDFLAQASPEPRWDSFSYPFAEDDIAELFYTSGTTGPPKGVMLTHRNLYLHSMGVMATMPIWETDVQLHLIALFHVNGWGTPHYLTAKGGTHVIQKVFDPKGMLELVQKEGVTRFYIVPTMVTVILEEPNIQNYDLSSLREILIGGAPPPTGMCAKAEEVFGCTVHGAFGMTETCPIIAAPELAPNLPPEIWKHRAHQTWGFPVIGTEYRVAGSLGEDIPWDGQSVGELLVRGDMVMKGYLNKPEATQKALAGGWYNSGDLVSMGPDGSLFIRDRQKDIIISGGENISSLEIEQTLYSHPDILECAVIGKKDPKWGEIPLAVVIPKAGSQLTAEEVVAFTREKLAHFKALREAVMVTDLPRSGTGKITKRALRERYG